MIVESGEGSSITMLVGSDLTVEAVQIPFDGFSL